MTDCPIALITGATGAIGQAIACRIAEAGHEVVIVARDAEKARRSVAAIKKAAGRRPVRWELADVSRPQQVQLLAARLSGPLHVLVNCAAECPRRREQTPEGIEKQFATNVLGYFWMMRAFEGALSEGAPSRIVNVASYWAGGLDLDDLEFERRRYDNDAAYRQSKQADRMLSAAFAERFSEAGIAVNACHPGDVRSKLSSDLGFGGHESAEEGAATPAWLATDPIGQAHSGRYFEHLSERADPFVQDRNAVEALYAACRARA